MNYYVETQSTDPYYNLAFEEYILKNYCNGNILMLWQNNNTVVVGLNQNTEEEINRNYITENKINVVRRNTGGGAVYHDMGNLNYSFITDNNRQNTAAFRAFSELVISALESMGVKAETSGRNDITIEDRKVSGTAQRVEKTRLLHHGTLLFDSNLSIIEAVLKSNKHKIVSRSSKSVVSRVANIKDFVSKDMTLETFWNYLRRELTDAQTQEIHLLPDEIKKIKELADTKYRSWEWVYGKSPEYTYKNKKKYSGGTVEILLDIEKGVIKDAGFKGDFMARMPVTPFVELIKGCRYEQETIKKLLDSAYTEDYFGAITKDELFGLFFE